MVDDLYKKKIVFLTPHDARYGFGLAGVIHYEVTEDKVTSLLSELITDLEIGILAIDERFLTVIGEQQLKELEKNLSGVLLILPSPQKAVVEEEDYLSRLIKKAIGYYVRIS